MTEKTRFYLLLGLFVASLVLFWLAYQSAGDVLIT